MKEGDRKRAIEEEWGRGGEGEIDGKRLSERRGGVVRARKRARERGREGEEGEGAKE